MDGILIILRIKLILQKRGIEIEPPEYEGGMYAGLKKYVFTNNRLDKLVIYPLYLKMFYRQLQLNSQPVWLTKPVSLFSIAFELNYP